MSKEEINALETILAQCKILRSSGLTPLALSITLCVNKVLRNLTTELKWSDDRG